MAAVPAATTANREYSPRATLKPANRNVVSDGIGMQALSATMSTKMPGRPEGVDHVHRELDDGVGEGGDDRHVAKQG